MTNVVIASAARTAVGSFGGSFANTPAHDLGTTVLEAVVDRAGIDKSEVSETILGQVLTAATGMNPARQALLELPERLPPETRSSSEPYALLCAQTIRARLGATWGLAETGAAGPSGNRYGDSAGHTCVAIAGPAEQVLTVETRVADREANMWMFARAALELLHNTLLQQQT